MNLRKHGVTLGLVGVAIAVAAVYAVDRGNISDAERRDRSTDVFPAYHREAVSRISIVQNDAQGGPVTLTFERRTEGDAGDLVWWMTSPRNERADAASVDKLLGDIEFAGVVRKVDLGAAGGMDAPRATGTMSMGAIEYRFALGGPAPTPEGAAYFKIDGEGAFVVTRDFVTSLLKPPDGYRERTVVPYLSLELARLEVKHKDGGFAIDRMDDVSFKLEGLGVRASRETLDRVWGALAEARAESFLEGAEAERALGDDPITIRFKPKDGRKDGELVIGGPCPGHPEDVVAIRRAPTPLSACVPRGAVPGLSTSAAELVDARLFAARGDELAEVAFESVPPGRALELARKGHGWHERKPRDRELASEEADSANDLAAALTKAEGTGVAAGDPKAPFAARARVAVRRGEEKGEEVLLVGPAQPGGGGVVRREGDGATLHVSEAVLRRLLSSEIAVRGRPLFGGAFEGKVASRVELRCDGQEELLVRTDAGWSMERPPGYKADAAGVADLVNAVTRAQAEAWVAESDDGSFGFGGPKECSIGIAFERDGAPLTAGVVFAASEPQAESVFGHLAGEPQVFLAPRSLRDEARRLLVDRSGFHVDAAAAASVTLTRGGAQVALRGRGGKLGFADGGGAELGDRIALALDALKADEVVHLGSARPDEGFAHPSLEVRVRTSGEGGSGELHFTVGDATMILKERMFYARIDGVDATFAIARDRLAPLLDAP